MKPNLTRPLTTKIALSSTQREELEAEISTSVLMIERRECSLIRAAEAKGKVIDFRPTTSPQAVLGVRLDRQKLAKYADLYRELGNYGYDQDPGRPGWAPLVPNDRWADPSDDREPFVD